MGEDSTFKFTQVMGPCASRALQGPLKLLLQTFPCFIDRQWTSDSQGQFGDSLSEFHRLSGNMKVGDIIVVLLASCPLLHNDHQTIKCSMG